MDQVTNTGWFIFGLYRFMASRWGGAATNLFSASWLDHAVSVRKRFCIGCATSEMPSAPGDLLACLRIAIEARKKPNTVLSEARSSRVAITTTSPSQVVSVATQGSVGTSTVCLAAWCLTRESRIPISDEDVPSSETYRGSWVAPEVDGPSSFARGAQGGCGGAWDGIGLFTHILVEDGRSSRWPRERRSGPSIGYLFKHKSPAGR